MVKKDKKSKTAEQKARVAAKQGKKAAQKEKKVKSKGAEDSDAEDIDLESVLAEYAKQQAQFLKVTETPCEPPTPRASATLIGSPSSAKELFLFGGEYYNGALATFFNDLFIYIIDKDQWRRVTSPNSPLPRSGHAWCRGGNAGGIYLFGGEFSSPKQGTFYHYNDFWRLEPSSREWTRLETKGKGPPARSGHRMTYYKNYILLFGGFQDTSQQTKYLQDLWIYDCQNFVWHNPILPPASQKPDARSSFSFHPHDAGAVICGGYSRVKSITTAGKQNKGGSQGVRSILKPTVHQDTWFLRITQPPPEAPSTSPPSVRWERRKKPTNLPNPPRAGATMAYHKGRGILFGGVHDVEESEEGIDSEFFDTLFAWNIERNRYFQLTLRRPRAPPKKQVPNEHSSSKRGRGKAAEADLLRNLATLETKGSIADVDADAMEIDQQQNPTSNVDLAPPPPPKPEKPTLMTMPHPRFNAQLAVQEDTLYLFGGTYEHGDREYTFDEMHAIDLGKLDGVQEIYRREPENWQGSDDDEDDDEDDNDDSDSDEEMEDEIPSGVPLPRPEPSPQPTKPTDPDPFEPPEPLTITDTRPHPRPFESLRDFFTRTSTSWQESLLLHDSSSNNNNNKDAAITTPAAGKGVKEVRKEAFAVAEIMWWECREEVRALEDEQEEAGIGEVVAVGERGEGGVRRR